MSWLLGRLPLCVAWFRHARNWSHDFWVSGSGNRCHRCGGIRTLNPYQKSELDSFNSAMKTRAGRARAFGGSL